jgi:predicted ester cyclase
MEKVEFLQATDKVGIMTIADYKYMFRHMPELFFNLGDLSLADAEIAADYVDHALPPQYPQGLPGLRQFVTLFRAGMPDVHYTVDHLTADDLIGEGDKVVQRLLARGTHSGELFGIPATGREIRWTEIHIGRYANGKLVEHWGNVDVLGIFQQMGVMPASPGSGERLPTPIPPAVARGQTTSSEKNKALMRRFIEEVWNQGNLDVADELFHPQATSPSAPQLPVGPAGVRAIANLFRSAFPDFHMTIEDLIAEADVVVGRFSQGGTHQGEFTGIAPTGRQVQFTEIGILRIAGGQVVESWYETDMLGLLQQLGSSSG